MLNVQLEFTISIVSTLQHWLLHWPPGSINTRTRVYSFIWLDNFGGKGDSEVKLILWIGIFYNNGIHFWIGWTSRGILCLRLALEKRIFSSFIYWKVKNKKKTNLWSEICLFSQTNVTSQKSFSSNNSSQIAKVLLQDQLI